MQDLKTEGGLLIVFMMLGFTMIISTIGAFLTSDDMSSNYYPIFMFGVLISIFWMLVLVGRFNTKNVSVNT